VSVEQLSEKLPPTYESEEQIRKDAPAALRVLKQKGAEDLAEMLGVS